MTEDDYEKCDYNKEILLMRIMEIRMMVMMILNMMIKMMKMVTMKILDDDCDDHHQNE